MGETAGESGLREDHAMTTQECARLIIYAMVRRKREVVMTFKGKWGRWVKLLAPNLVDQMALAAVKANFRPRA
jgi:hypothetical protein